MKLNKKELIEITDYKINFMVQDYKLILILENINFKDITNAYIKNSFDIYIEINHKNFIFFSSKEIVVKHKPINCFLTTSLELEKQEAKNTKLIELEYCKN